jgi:hypothetical protein
MLGQMVLPGSSIVMKTSGVWEREGSRKMEKAGIRFTREFSKIF